MSAFNSSFQAAIPGSSIAHHKLGDLPHEKPPKYVDPNEALEYFWKQLNRPDMLKQLWLVLEQGATTFAIARAILYKAAMEGIIQGNLAIVIYPTVQQMIITIGKAKGIDVKIHPKFRNKTEDDMKDAFINEKTGSKKGGKVPGSALRTMNIPKPEAMTSGADFLKGAIPKEQPKPQDNKGLLNMAQEK